MDITSYLKALAKMQLDSGSILTDIVDDVAREVTELVFGWAIEQLNFKDSKIYLDEDSVKALLKFDSFVMKSLEENKKYSTSVSSFIKSFPRMTYLVVDFQTFANDIKITSGLLTSSEKIVVNEVIDSLAGNGLNAGFAQPLRDLMYRQIAAGSSQRELKSIIKEWVVGDKKMGHFGRYIEQTSQQAVEAYPDMLNKKLMQTFTYPYLLMTGSLIKTSSPQCVEVIQVYDGLISRETWRKEIRPLAAQNGLIENTNFDNLTFNKNHWGCRHTFTPMMTDPYQKEKNEKEAS